MRLALGVIMLDFGLQVLGFMPHAVHTGTFETR
jgi:hypothetical protein